MNRPQGVVVPQSQQRETQRGEPNKVYAVVPAKVVGVQYADGTGQIIKEFWYQIGDQFYIPPEAERFASKLKLVKDSFADQAKTLLSAAEAPSSDVPQEDIVDVVSKQVAAGADET